MTSCHAHDSLNSPDGQTVHDPVCGMTVDPGTTAHKSSHQGEAYFFCSAHCKKKFDTDPESYKDGPPEAEPMPEGTLYTCPMHPEIVQEGPGSCPKCGMALEPMGIPTGDEGPDPEFIDFRRRFWIGTLFTVPLFLLAMAPFFGLGAIREAIGERTAA